MRITKSEDAYFLAGAIVTYKTNVAEYGRIQGDIWSNGTIYAKVSYRAVHWKDEDEGSWARKHKPEPESERIGTELFIFTKPNLTLSNVSITTSKIKKYGYLDVKYATEGEVAMLKLLAENNGTKLFNSSKEETVEILTNYLAQGIPKPHISLDFKQKQDGYETTHSVIIDFHDMSKEKAEWLNSKYNLDISMEIAHEIANLKTCMLGMDNPIDESYSS